MKKKMVLLVVVAVFMSGCAMSSISRVERNTVFGQPVEQLVTTVCHPSGYEVTQIETYLQGETGNPRLINSNAAGGPGIGYAIGVGVTAGTGAAATGGLLNVWAAHELRPDQTTVRQTGGGATSTGVAGSVSGNSGTIEGGSGGNVTASTTNVNVSNAEAVAGAVAYQTQGQQQVQAQQQQQQSVVNPVQQASKPSTNCNKPNPVVSVPQNQKQNQVVGINN